MSVKDRLIKFLKWLNISQRAFEREIGLSNGYVNNIRKSIQPDKVQIIALHYPVLNIGWLMTGEGPMLRPVERTGESPPEAQGEGKTGVCAACEDKERVIAMKDEMLAMKDEAIKGKDKQIEALERQIEDLKNNLGMVIASKDEMLAMKEEAIKSKEATLAAKEELISIQSKRISELESHHEAEDLKKILGSVERTGKENTSVRNLQSETLASKAKEKNPQP